MMRWRFATRFILAAGITSTLAGGLPAQDEPTLPMRLRATVMVLNSLAPGTVKVEAAGTVSATDPMRLPVTPAPQMIGADPRAGGSKPAIKSALLAITIDRFSTDEETSSLVQALKSGGTSALVSAMENTTVGYLHVNGDLRWPIRIASTWKTEAGRVVRLATSGPILYGGSAPASLDTDYPIGILEFTLPPTGRGEGSLVAATRAAFDDQDRIVARAMPINTGTQRLTNVEREAPDKGVGEK